jgi:hypothetical protein
MKAIKVSAEAVKLAKLAGKHQSANTGKAAPKKKMRSTKATTGIIRELHPVAAFQAQLFIFTRVEKTKADLRYPLIEEQFHGCPHKRIKGDCAQLIEGSGAFRLLYDVREGEDDVEFVLKPSCCGKEPSSSYVAGVHFTEDDFRTFGHNKKVNVRALWAMGLKVLRSIKKALSIVPKLSPWIVMLKKKLCCRHGMFVMTINEGDDVMIVDGNDRSDDDNEVLGAVPEAGMPMTKDDK